MKTIKKIFTPNLLVSFLGFTSYQNEDNNLNGNITDTNGANSQSASNIELSPLNDGSLEIILAIGVITCLLVSLYIQIH